MPHAHTFGRLTSAAVIVAVVVVTVLGVCSAVFGGPVTGGTVAGASACPVDSYGSHAVAGMPAESPRISGTGFAIIPVQALFDISQRESSESAVISAELPPPPDPRHGVTRV